ncbi:hypothetical protein V6Z11_D03G110800 [Gossypium hirsutum]
MLQYRIINNSGFDPSRSFRIALVSLHQRSVTRF